MKKCSYCGAEYPDDVVTCAVDHMPVETRVEPAPPRPKHSVEFIRLFFKSPIEEEFAVRCADFIAGVVGDRVLELRPDTKWSEILQWFGPKPAHSVLFAMLLKKAFGPDVKEIIDVPELMTFRDFVEYACSHKQSAA